MLWRTGIVRLIFKKGCKNNVSNYRPICLTSSVSKVMERIVCQGTSSYLTEKSFIHNNQHGFLKHRSTLSALLATVPLWHRERHFISVRYIDYAKPLTPSQYHYFSKSWILTASKVDYNSFCAPSWVKNPGGASEWLTFLFLSHVQRRTSRYEHWATHVNTIRKRPRWLSSCWRLLQSICGWLQNLYHK